MSLEYYPESYAENFTESYTKNYSGSQSSILIAFACISALVFFTLVIMTQFNIPPVFYQVILAVYGVAFIWLFMRFLFTTV